MGSTSDQVRDDKWEDGYTKQRNVILDAFIKCCHSRESGNPETCKNLNDIRILT